MSNMKTVLLGATDPEMHEIERIALEHGVTVAHATIGGRRVNGGTAYKADGATRPLEGRIIAVECGGPVLTGHDVVKIDHHNPGDPGFGRGPKEFAQASSLGQFLEMLGLEPTANQLHICAADHCLGAAYKGQCPGIDPTALRAWRCESRARFFKRTVAEQTALIEATLAELMQLPTVTVGDAQFRDARAQIIEEMPEASAIAGIPVIYAMPSPQGVKVGVLNGTPAEIRAFLANVEVLGLRDPYGDPERGYAGAYQR